MARMLAPYVNPAKAYRNGMRRREYNRIKYGYRTPEQETDPVPRGRMVIAWDWIGNLTVMGRIAKTDVGYIITEEGRRTLAENRGWRKR